MTDLEFFRQQTDVSRETFEMLQAYADLVAEWTPKINLVSRNTLAELWTRHFLDSAQLLDRFDKVNHWVDLGSGGGFPGAVVAIIAGPGQKTTLIEADQRKAAFLRVVARETVGFEVIAKRIEDAPPQNADVVSARALAPLPLLLNHVHRHLAPEGTAVLPKGRKAPQEVEEALEHWRFDCETYPSKTDPDAVILTLGEIKRV